MLCLMLDSRYKNLILIFSFIGCEQKMVILHSYDNKSLFHMFLKCYHHLQPLLKVNYFFHNKNEKYCSFDIFEMVVTQVSFWKSLSIKICWHFKNIKCMQKPSNFVLSSGKKWDHVPNYWLFGVTNIEDNWFPIWN